MDRHVAQTQTVSAVHAAQTMHRAQLAVSVPAQAPVLAVQKQVQLAFLRVLPIRAVPTMEGTAEFVQQSPVRATFSLELAGAKVPVLVLGQDHLLPRPLPLLRPLQPLYAEPRMLLAPHLASAATVHAKEAACATSKALARYLFREK